jgi:hypothetical protein
MCHALRRARWLRPSDGRWTRDGAGPGSEPRGGTDPDVLQGATPGGGSAFPDAGGLLGRERPHNKARGPAKNGGEGNGGTVVGAKEPESLWATRVGLGAKESVRKRENRPDRGGALRLSHGVAGSRAVTGRHRLLLGGATGVGRGYLLRGPVPPGSVRPGGRGDALPMPAYQLAMIDLIRDSRKQGRKCRPRR